MNSAILNTLVYVFWRPQIHIATANGPRNEIASHCVLSALGDAAKYGL